MRLSCGSTEYIIMGIVAVVLACMFAVARDKCKHKFWSSFALSLVWNVPFAYLIVSQWHYLSYDCDINTTIYLAIGVAISYAAICGHKQAFRDFVQALVPALLIAGLICYYFVLIEPVPLYRTYDMLRGSGRCLPFVIVGAPLMAFANTILVRKLAEKKKMLCVGVYVASLLLHIVVLYRVASAMIYGHTASYSVALQVITLVFFLMIVMFCHDHHPYAHAISSFVICFYLAWATILLYNACIVPFFPPMLFISMACIAALGIGLFFRVVKHMDKQRSFIFALLIGAALSGALLHIILAIIAITLALPSKEMIYIVNVDYPFCLLSPLAIPSIVAFVIAVISAIVYASKNGENFFLMLLFYLSPTFLVVFTLFLGYTATSAALQSNIRFAGMTFVGILPILAIVTGVFLAFINYVKAIASNIDFCQRKEWTQKGV